MSLALKINQKHPVIIFIMAGLVLTACNIQTHQTAPTTDIVLPEPTVTSEIPAGTLTIDTKTYEEHQETFNVEINIPVFSSVDLPTGQINALMDEMATTMMNQFKKDIADLPVEMAASGTTSYVDMDYSIGYNDHNLVSIVFDIEQYMAGAAHPNHLVGSVNYDFAEDKVLSLDDLFTAEVDVNQLMSELTTKSLTDQGMPLTSGIVPVDSIYYQSWAITSDELVIWFSAGDVTPYAAGVLQAPIPFSEIQEKLDPAGSLGFIFE